MAFSDWCSDWCLSVSLECVLYRVAVCDQYARLGNGQCGSAGTTTSVGTPGSPGVPGLLGSGVDGTGVIGVAGLPGSVVGGAPVVVARFSTSPASFSACVMV